MSKPVRPGLAKKTSTGEIRVFKEALNRNYGYYYTINKTLHTVKTKYQQLELVDTDEFGKVLILDGITQVGEGSEYSYHEPMVHPALCSHSKPESVLIIGGGDGGILREVLKYNSVKSAVLVDLDGEVISFSKKYLRKVHRGAFNDPRATVIVGDGRAYTDNHPGEFDVVIMDMTDPFGPSRLLYTQEFFQIIKKTLKNESGIFVMHSESPISRPSTFACINRTLSSVFDHVNQFYTYVQMYGVLWAITVSSPSIDTSKVRKPVIESRLKKNGITDLKVYNSDSHCAMQTAYPFISELLRKPSRVITDKRLNFPDGIGAL